MSDIPIITRCNTCKAAFTTIELIREHYKTDWHVFNSKRRANNLLHVTLEEYKRQYITTKKNTNTSSSNNNTSSSTNTTTTNNNNNNNKGTKQNSPKKTSSSTTTTTTTSLKNNQEEQKEEVKEEVKENLKENHENNNEITESLKNLALELGVESERVDDIVTNALQQKLPGDEDDEEGDDDDEEEEEEPIIVEPNVSIFDDKEFPTIEECFSYMESKFGLFIPEREYVVDLPGLLVYLGEKVKIGGICLYCQKHMRPGRPCQNHMIDKGHCKLAYEEGVDLDEYEDFYDFSSSYENNGQGNDDNDDDEDVDNEETLEISPIGELILTDGRTVGHRAFRKYYRQKHKPIDNRIAISNQRREDILKFHTSNLRSNDIVSLGLTSSANIRNTLNGVDLRRLSDNEIMLLIVKKHKELKRMQQIEQRAQKRHEYRHNRAEYMSTKDQLRARINRTDKIRDYHGMLM